MMDVVLAQLMGLLNDPAVVAIVTPVLVKAFSTCLNKVHMTLPKGLHPVMALAIGSLAAACGDMTWMTGGMSGVAGVGIRELFKPLSRAVVANVLTKK